MPRQGQMLSFAVANGAVLRFALKYLALHCGFSPFSAFFDKAAALQPLFLDNALRLRRLLRWTPRRAAFNEALQ